MEKKRKKYFYADVVDKKICSDNLCVQGQFSVHALKQLRKAIQNVLDASIPNKDQNRAASEIVNEYFIITLDAHESFDEATWEGPGISENDLYSAWSEGASMAEMPTHDTSHKAHQTNCS